MAGRLDFFDESTFNTPAPKVEEKKVERFDDSKMHANESVNLFDMEEEVVAAPVEEKAEEVVSQPEEIAAPELSREEQKSLDKAIKKLQALYGEEKYELPVEAKLKHKVDNEEVELSIQELLNNYSGKQSWDKKFSELDKERKTHKAEIDYVNQYVAEFARRSKEDPIAAFEFLAEFAGADPLQFRKQLRQQFVDKWGNYMSMDEAQRNLIDTQEENEYFRKKYEMQVNMQREAQAKMERDAQFKQLEQSYGISEDRRIELANDLKTLGNVNDITPELILNLHQAYERQDRAIAALDKIDPAFIQDTSKFTLAESLLSSNPNMTDDELLGMLNKLWGNDISKATHDLGKKVKQQPKQEAQMYQPKQKASNRISFFD